MCNLATRTSCAVGHRPFCGACSAGTLFSASWDAEQRGQRQPHTACKIGLRAQRFHGCHKWAQCAHVGWLATRRRGLKGFGCKGELPDDGLFVGSRSFLQEAATRRSCTKRVVAPWTMPVATNCADQVLRWRGQGGSPSSVLVCKSAVRRKKQRRMAHAHPARSRTVVVASRGELPRWGSGGRTARWVSANRVS
jgi:hypothetical protein